MKKIFATALMISAAAFSTRISAFANEPTRARCLTISLEQQKGKDRDVVLYPSGGTFFELENGKIAFFNSDQYAQFRKMLSQLPGSTQQKLLLFDPVSKRSQLKSCPIVITSKREVTVEGIIVAKASMERLRLSTNWDAVLVQPWQEGCSIIYLGNDRFLKTGGVNPDSNFFQHCSKATIINCKSGEIEKEFFLKSLRKNHSTIALLDGRVFCVGGETDGAGGTAVSSTAEIIDLVKGESILIRDQLPTGLDDMSICLDADGNPILLGGCPKVDTALDPYTHKDILRFDLETEKFLKVGTLNKARYFPRELVVGHVSAAHLIIENNAVLLNNGQILIDGGASILPSLFADFRSGSVCSAELVTLPN